MGAALVAIRPADKAALAEAASRKYREIANEPDIAVALIKARQSDPQVIEALRMAAFNDVVREVGQANYVEPLTMRQRLIAALA